MPIDILEIGGRSGGIDTDGEGEGKDFPHRRK
jgi:hypothetical protein